MTHPPNAMPDELQVAHYIAQIVKLEKLNAELRESNSNLKAIAIRSDEENTRLEALNAELIEALQRAVEWRGQDPEFHSYAVKLIAKAEGTK